MDFNWDRIAIDVFPLLFRSWNMPFIWQSGGWTSNPGLFRQSVKKKTDDSDSYKTTAKRCWKGQWNAKTCGL